MKNVLLDKGIILPSGEISKDKVNLVTGAITQPFAEMVWVTTGGDMETVNRLTDVLVTMNTPRRPGKLFKIIKKCSTGLWACSFSEEAEPMDADPAVFGILHFFLYGRLWRSHTRPHSRRSRITHRTGGVSHFPQGRTGTPLFSCPLLRSRQEKALDLRGFAGAVFSG
ncbi:MAG: hypothetical protein L6V89_09580 [Oscillospiraceae bacterium]|nr:MAG: hypothetical protein L6V89_09580 [Oscillospiraceae bacterium]